MRSQELSSSALPRRRGFSLAELLVIIGIFGVLMGLLLPAIIKARDAALRVECANNLRQIGFALHQYHEAHKVLPPGCSYRNDADPFPHMSWCTRLLPFVEQKDIWDEAVQAFAKERFFVKNPPHTPLSKVVPVFTCPADGRTRGPIEYSPIRVGLLSYLGVEGTDQFRKDGVLFLDSRVRLSDIADGTSNTLMVGERPPSYDLVAGWWYAGWGQDKDGSIDMVLGVRERNVNRYYRTSCSPGPYQFGPDRTDNPCAAFHFWSVHVAGGHFLFADGTVRFLRYDAAPLMPALATRAGGEAVSLPD